MSILQGRLPGATVADLFAGSGALGLEAISRGARSVTFVEKSRRALGVLRRNITTLGAKGQSRVIIGDVMVHLRSLEASPYDIAFADPPYGRGIVAHLLSHYLKKPFARELWVEHRSDDPLPELPGLKQHRYGDTMLTGVTPPVP